MGVFFGIAAAAAFGGGAVLNRVGMRHRENDNGVLMTIFVNVVVLGAAMLFVPMPSFDPRGILAFVGAGLLGTFFGRATNLRAVRLIGPSRANALLTTAPLVSAAGGWIVLGEAVGWVSAGGALIVLVGLRIVMRSPVSAEVPTAVSSGGDARTESSEADPHRRALSGYVMASIGAVFFGMAFVVRKLGILWFPSAVVGAFLGALSALVGVAIVDGLGGRIKQRWKENFRSIPWWFVAGGLATSAALLFQFIAYFDLPAWTVSLFQGTQVMWTLLWSYVWLRREERLSAELIAGISLVVVGVSIVAVQVG